MISWCFGVLAIWQDRLWNMRAMYHTLGAWGPLCEIGGLAYDRVCKVYVQHIGTLGCSAGTNARRSFSSQPEVAVQHDKTHTFDFQNLAYYTSRTDYPDVILPSHTTPDPLPEPNQPPPTQNIPHTPLHLLKPHKPTTLALPVPKQRRQRREFPSTPRLRTMISLLPMHARIQMLVQRAHGPEAAVAEIALPFVPIPRGVRGAVGRGRGVLGVPADLLVGDEVVRVALADDLEDAVAV